MKGAPASFGALHPNASAVRFDYQSAEGEAEAGRPYAWRVRRSHLLELLKNDVVVLRRNPRAGIIQTNPQPVLGESLYQRFQQFMACVYRPMFNAGANFWQLGSGSFWGHNAIVRLKLQKPLAVER